MILKLRNPLAFFDLETTGINISQDKIIEIAVVKIFPGGERKNKTTRINPQIPIPPEATLIHGIRDEDVRDAPPFKQIAAELANFLEGCDLAGFNIIKFDVPMLVEEFLRSGVEFEIGNKKLIDAQKLFHMMEKRTLSAAYQFYCGKTLVNAHSALGDTLASIEVLESQIERYVDADVTDLNGNVIGKIANDMSVLHQLTNEKMIDLAGRMTYDSQGEEVFNFGKHKGKKIRDVFKSEPSYYDWMLKNDFPLDTKRKLTQIRIKSMLNKSQEE
ncbi:MAG TPA: 3'-5' exonuclease [Cyclobacteriaceae bacterium]|nr:3'-5' exonuclease [Cyclobacteriaceae bacterium]